ncbi:hypothetical protein V6N12_034488 [Hibiscus sabdariffa]|uniref:Uncharacterized protein n=1 Tax=Hibiscus sabdariffa TaxID=183260 RepID=A0ABR2DIY1_9ROSI
MFQVPKLDINYSLGLRLRSQVLAMLVLTLSFACNSGGIVYSSSQGFSSDGDSVGMEGNLPRQDEPQEPIQPQNPIQPLEPAQPPQNPPDV